MADPGELSKRERQIMDVVYAHGEATVTQVLAEMPDPPGAGRADARAYPGAQGVSDPPREGPRVRLSADAAARGGAVGGPGRVVDVFFGGSLESAVAAHLSDPRRAGKLTARNCTGFQN